jgi:hypothetical protein
MDLPMQTSIKRRFPLFFKDGTFHIQIIWDHENDREGEVLSKGHDNSLFEISDQIYF